MIRNKQNGEVCLLAVIVTLVVGAIFGATVQSKHHVLHDSPGKDQKIPYSSIAPMLILGFFFMLFPTLLMAQGLIDTIPTAASNSVCLADTCLTGASAVLLTVFTVLVTVATFALKFIKDKTTWYGKIVDKIANLKIKK